MSIYERVDSSFFIAQDVHHLEGGLVLRVNEKKWTFRLPPFMHFLDNNFKASICPIDAIVSPLKRQLKPFAGTRNEHAETVSVMHANWHTLVEGFSKQSPPKNVRQPVSYVDILMGPTKNGAYKQLDLIGNGVSNGVLVVEVGTKGKTKQLLEQIDVCRHVLGDVPVLGLLAYYSFNRHARTVNVSIPEIT